MTSPEMLSCERRGGGEFKKVTKVTQSLKLKPHSDDSATVSSVSKQTGDDYDRKSQKDFSATSVATQITSDVTTTATTKTTAATTSETTSTSITETANTTKSVQNNHHIPHDDATQTPISLEKQHSVLCTATQISQQRPNGKGLISTHCSKLPNGLSAKRTDHIVYIEYDSKTEEETVLVIQRPTITASEIKSIGSTGLADMTCTGENGAAKSDKLNHHHQQYQQGDAMAQSFWILLNKNKSLQCAVSLVVLFMFLTASAFIMALIAVTNHTTCRCEPKPSALQQQVANTCPVGWRLFGDSCYGSVTRQRLNNSEAELSCREQGSALFSPDTEAEVEFMRRYFLEPKWRYLELEEQVHVGQDSLGLMDGSNGGECVQMSRYGTLQSVDCSSQLNFYCEQKM